MDRKADITHPGDPKRVDCGTGQFIYKADRRGSHFGKLRRTFTFVLVSKHCFIIVSLLWCSSIFNAKISHSRQDSVGSLTYVVFKH